jgi:hypothetical protein
MKYKQPFIAAILLISACILPPAHARADTVLYDGSGFLTGTQSFVESFNLPSAGILTVTLSNVAWPEQLASLNLLLTSVGGTLGPEMGAGTATFNIAAGGNVYAQWFGKAQGPLDIGVYSMKIDFAPAGTAVPLPPAIVLFISGLALMLLQRRSRSANVVDARCAPGLSRKDGRS